MKKFERRLRALEAATVATTKKPWRSVVVHTGETEAEVLAREGIGPGENVIVTTIVDPKPAKRKETP